MAESIGKTLRMSEFMGTGKRPVLLVDTSLAGSNGPVGALLDADKSIPEVAYECDGIILNPGQMERIAHRLPGKQGAAPLVRVDWSNAFRDKNYVLPTRKVERVVISRAEDALELGANAAVTYFLLGFDEDFESENVRSIAALARECSRINLPLLVDVRPVGPKIGETNWAGAIKLAVGFMVEGGADAILIPDPGVEAFATLMEFSPVPLLLQETADSALDEKRQAVLAERYRAGAAGLAVGADLFEQPDYAKATARLREFLAGHTLNRKVG